VPRATPLRSLCNYFTFRTIGRGTHEPEWSNNYCFHGGTVVIGSRDNVFHLLKSKVQCHTRHVWLTDVGLFRGRFGHTRVRILGLRRFFTWRWVSGWLQLWRFAVRSGAQILVKQRIRFLARVRIILDTTRVAVNIQIYYILIIAGGYTIRVP